MTSKKESQRITLKCIHEYNFHLDVHVRDHAYNIYASQIQINCNIGCRRRKKLLKTGPTTGAENETMFAESHRS